MNPYTCLESTRPRRNPRRRARRLLLAFACACLVFNSGCTSMRTLDVQPQRGAPQDLRLREEATLLLRDGRTLELTVLGMTDTSLIGRDATGTAYTIDWRDISKVQVSRVSASQTTFLVVGVAILLAAVLAAAISQTYGDPWEPSYNVGN